MKHKIINGFTIVFVSLVVVLFLLTALHFFYPTEFHAVVDSIHNDIEPTMIVEEANETVLP